MSSSEAIKQIPVAVGGLVKKLEDAAKNAVTDIEEKGRETLNKIERAKGAVIAPLREADALLDDLIGGHNGGPEMEAGPEDAFRTVGGTDSRPSASTAAVPQPSTLGAPTGGVRAGDK